ncbi:MAG: hypothetical protein ABI255_08745 [Microbacteriaceae bacterium]
MSAANLAVWQAAAAEVERALRAERSAIAGLRVEIDDALGSLLPASGQCWQSAAQRAYAARLDELCRLVQAALGQLAEAVGALDRAIASVTAGRQ